MKRLKEILEGKTDGYKLTTSKPDGGISVRDVERKRTGTSSVTKEVKLDQKDSKNYDYDREDFSHVEVPSGPNSTRAVTKITNDSDTRQASSNGDSSFDRQTTLKTKLQGIDHTRSGVSDSYVSSETNVKKSSTTSKTITKEQKKESPPKPITYYNDKDPIS